MRLDEYLETVTSQIRYTKIRGDITEELRNHILDQAESYENCGAFPEEALERAVREMGDPVETGVALDRIHRPQMNWSLVALIGLLNLFSIGIFYAANMTGFDIYSWQRHALYTAIGFLSMLIIYRLDYSFLSKFSWQPCLIYIGLLMLGLLIFGQSLNGIRQWILIPYLPFGISVSDAILLYVPMFGAALYSFRGDGYGILWKAGLLSLLPVIFIAKRPDLSSALILFASLFCLFLFAVWKDWYQISKKNVLGICGSLLLLNPIILLGYIYFFGADYHIERLKAFFFSTGTSDYIANIAKSMRESSALLGSSPISVEYFTNGPTTEFLTDYILASMCTLYGSLLTIAIIAMLMLIIIKVFQISVTQKNQLGMIIGLGCGLAFFTKTLVCILVNFQLIPYVSISMPFLSYGGSGILVSYMLLGLVLSVYRYKNILPKESTSSRKRRYLKITWETRT